MRKVLLSVLALCSMGVASAQMASGVQARVYAYDLQQTSSVTDVTTYTLKFKTNTAATSAFVNLKDKEGVVKYTIPADYDDETRKNWTATVDVYKLKELNLEPVEGYYNWEVTVSAPAVEEFAQLSDDKSNIFSIYRSYALSVDNSPESDYFGRLYVVNQYPGTACAKNYPQETKNGIYTYTPTLEAENNGNNYHAVGFIGDVAKRGESANDMTITADGRIFISNLTTDRAGIYYVNPKTFEYTKTSVSSPIAGIGSYGYGEDTQIYGIDMTNSTNGVINRYDIGEDNQWTIEPVTFSTFTKSGYNIIIKGNTYSTSYTTGNSIVPVSTGFWVSQYSANAGITGTPLFYCNNEGTVKWAYGAEGLNGEYKIANDRYGALAVNEDLGLVACVSVIDNIANARVFNYSVNSNGSLKTTFIGNFPMTMQGARSNALSFDYAGNLYSVNEGAELLNIYTLPTDNNTRTTPAKKAMTIEITPKDITVGVDNIAFDVNAPVEYYNLQGVKVENPTKGIFIKKQGTKATKVVL